ncbi:hypothetical protein BDL97_01G144200 [Sphagnum fallax]|nr:hypothetical protein BDL97_01G144200 [Sphagnum fallax]
MDEGSGAMKGPRRYSSAVGTIKLEDFIQEFDSWCDMQMLRNARLFSPFLAWKGLFQHLEGPPMDDYHEFRRDHVTEIEEWRQHWSPSYVSITYSGVASGGTMTPSTPSTSTQVVPPPSFNPITEFLRLKKNYQGVTEKLRSLQEFERKTNESLRKAYTRMRRLIAVTQGVTKVQAVQFWYGILDKELQRRTHDVTLMSDDSPTLAHVFALSEKIELNMVEERVVTSGFNRDIVTTYRGQQSTSQLHTGGGGSRGGQVRPQLGSGRTGAQRPLLSFTNQQQGPSCWTCGGAHIRRDYPQESGGWTLADGSQSAQVQCDNYGRVGHPRERCFDLYPELRSGRGGGRGGATQRGRGGRGGRGGGAGRGTPMVRAPPLITPPPTTEVAMAIRIEQLEQRLATMASFQHQSHSRGEAPTSYGGDDLFYMASVAQIEASIAVTKGVTRASEPRAATVELDPHRGETSKQARLPQSFLLSKVVKTPSMVPTPPIEPTVEPTASTSRVVDMDISSSVASRMVTSVLGSPTFSTNDLMASGVNLTLGDVVVEQPVVSGVDSLWQAAAAKMDALPTRPAIDRERLTPSVCMLDNRSGIFRLVSPTGQVYKPDRVLLDSGAQPLMLGKAACIGLGIRRSELELCPFQI